MTESPLTTASPGSCTDLPGPLVEWVLEEMCIWIWASLISLRLFRVSLMLQEWARTAPEKMRMSLSACHNTTQVSKERSEPLISWWKFSLRWMTSVCSFRTPVEAFILIRKVFLFGLSFFPSCLYGTFLEIIPFSSSSQWYNKYQTYSSWWTLKPFYFRQMKELRWGITVR